MNTRKALGIFAGVDAGDTFLSDPRAVERFSRAASARQEDILRKQQQPHVSQPHARLAADVANEALRASMLNQTSPLVDKFSAYQTAKKYASQTGADGGLRALAQHLRVQWEGDRDGFFSAADLVRMREHFSKSFGRTAAIDLLSNAIPRAGVGDLPVRRLQQFASQIRHQADYEAICRQAGLDGNRPDQVRARAYLRALVRRAAEGGDEGGANMNPDVIEQQGASLSGIPADDGGGVLSGADLQVGQNHAKAGSLPTEKQVTAAVLDANVVKIAGYSIFVNDADQVELRTPRGTSRQASISHLSFVVRDFLKLAQAANFEPSVNEQQDPYVDISEEEGGDVLGKDSTSDDKATNAITLGGKPKAQHPAQDQAGTSAGDKPLGEDSAGKDPTWGNPSLSGAHASDPHDQSGTSFSDRDLGADHQQDTPGWEDPGPIQTSRKGRLDDSPFLAGGDPADRYRRARQDRPSARLLEGIGDEEGWLSRRVLAQMEGGDVDTGKGDEAQTPAISDVAKEAARSPVRLREDVFQIGDGFQDRQADSRLVYTFAYDQKIGQPRISEMQQYIDTCCGGVRAYRVASVSQVSPGVVRTIVIEAQSEAAPSMFGGGDGGSVGDDGGSDGGAASDLEAKHMAVRIAMGKVTAVDHGNDPEGMGSDYQGTVLNKEGQSAADLQWGLEKDRKDLQKMQDDLARIERGEQVENLTRENAQQVIQALTQTIQNKENLLAKQGSAREAKSPPGWAKTVEKMKDHPEIDNPFALAWSMHDKGDKPGGNKKGGVSDVPGVGLPQQPKEGTQKAVKPVKDVPSFPSQGQPKQGGRTAQTNECMYCGDYVGGNKSGGVCDGCQAQLDRGETPQEPARASPDKCYYCKKPIAVGTGECPDCKAMRDRGEAPRFAGRTAQPWDETPSGQAPFKSPACPSCGSKDYDIGSGADDFRCRDCGSMYKDAARISEGWGEGGEYKREIDAESAQEVWELHRGLGGEAPDFKALQQLQQQRQQQEAQATPPVEPRPDAGGQVRLPEPEPETMNAEQQLPQPQAPQPQQQAPQQARQAQQGGQTTFCEQCSKTFNVPPGQSTADATLCEDCERKKYDEDSERKQDSQSWGQY